jgi:hypothetical protein
MLSRARTLTILKRGGWLVVAAGLAAAAAQPAPQQAAQPAAPSAQVAPPPVSEEAPPSIVPTPQPLVVPPITEKEVAPAPPEQPEKAEAPKAPEQPQRRPRYDVAILQALDKVTAETLRFEAPVGKPIRYKTLVFTVRACEHTAPDEPVEDNVAYVEILSQPRAEPGRPVLPARQAFKGWMYASSPSLNPLEHPVYSAWLISCRTAAPVSPAAAPAPASPGR